MMIMREMIIILTVEIIIQTIFHDDSNVNNCDNRANKGDYQDVHNNGNFLFKGNNYGNDNDDIDNGDSHCIDDNVGSNQDYDNSDEYEYKYKSN